MTNKSHNNNQTQYYKSADQPTIQPVLTPYVLRHTSSVLNFGGFEKEEKLLEVGAGMGRFSHIIKSQGFDITASDLSPELIEKIKNNHPSLPSLTADINNLKNTVHTKFDNVIGFFMLHHLPDLTQSFKSISEVLKPKGKVVFCEPSAWYFPFYLQILLTPRMKWSVDKGVLNMRQKNFDMALKASGFENIEYHYYGYLPPFLYNKKLGKKIDDKLSQVILPQRSKAFIMIKANLK